MQLSDSGARLIAQFEGFRSCPYRDAVGVWTIGYGSTRGVGPRSKCITRAEALERMKREVDRVYGKAVNALGLPLNQNQHDALTSFVYNLGPGAIGPGTGIGKALRARQWKRAADEMLRWDKAGGRTLAGLTRRRRAERRRFLAAPPVDYSAMERSQFERLRKGGPAERRDARRWLEKHADHLRHLARQDGSWKLHDRGRRYQGIRRRLRT
jgi:GH24 family phage-related lysozyme (muramidase)